MKFGVLVRGGDGAAQAARAFHSLGFECVEIEFWEDLGGVDLGRLADSFASLRKEGCPVSSLGVYGNILDPEGRTRASLGALLEAAGSFGAPIVSCFAGRVKGRSVPESLESWKAVFGPLAEAASARGLVIAMENCRLGDTWKTGKWNIAINPDAWELLFAALPGAPIGLEWEPAHQLLALADPRAQLEAWAGKVVHVHGKDARLDRETLAVKGYFAANRVGLECLPGEGDSEWGGLLRILAGSGYVGSVDLELPSGGGEEEAAKLSRLTASLDYLRASARAKPPFPAGTRIA